MRRSDREIKEYADIVSVIKSCDVCRLALNDEEYPYIIPLNFGFDDKNAAPALYFHSANEGTKLNLIRKDCRASFEMDCGHRLVPDYDAKMCTMEFESVIGYGKITILSDDEKKEALKILMKQYHHDEFPINDKVLPMTTVFRLDIENMTGKRRVKR